MIDALVVWGDPATVKARLDKHLAAGAEHVCVQPIPAPGSTSLDDLRTIAAELFA